MCLSVKEYDEIKACAACGVQHNVDTHHIITRGARPDLENYMPNCIPLCRVHHIEVHKKGLTYFANKYNLNNELLNRGFYRCGLTNKWRINV